MGRQDVKWISFPVDYSFIIKEESILIRDGFNVVSNKGGSLIRTMALLLELDIFDQSPLLHPLRPALT